MNLLFRAALAAVSVQALLAQANPSPGQNTLYILNALTGMGFDFDSSATLYALDSSGQVRLAGSLASGDRQDGVDFVFADYDRRVIVAAAPKTTPARISYLSMDEPSAITQRPFGMPALYDRFSEISACIIEPTAGQPAVAQVLGRTLVAPTPDHPRPQMEFRLFATPLTASGEPVALADGEETDCRSSGYFGTVWDHPPSIFVDVQANTDLRVSHAAQGKFSLGIPSPPTAQPTPVGTIEVKTDEAMVVTSQEESTFDPTGLGTSVHYVYSMQSKTWSPLKLPGSDTTVRAFGNWLAFEVAERQGWAVPNAKGVISSYDPARERYSPGSTGRATNFLPGSKRQPMDNVFAQSIDWFPGTLLCYNVQSGKLYTLDTGQGDSEVVLIDGSNVYYRVNTSLYKGTIGATMIGPGVRIADDPAIGSVHWAFFGPAM